MMGKRWTDLTVARQVADYVTNAWMAAPASHAIMLKNVAPMVAAAADCPECEVCCAIGLCCPPGSEEQRSALARLLVKG